MYIKFKYKTSNKTFVLANDTHGYQVGYEGIVKAKEEGEEDGVRIAPGASYFATLPSALSHIFERGIKQSDAVTFAELGKDIREVRGLIEEIKSHILSVE